MSQRPNSDVLVVLTTAPSRDEAASLARALVERRCAACVNILPEVRSIYSWEQKVCDDPEVLLIIKTNRDHFEKLASDIRELHSYEVPEIVALPAAAVDEPYAAWLASVLT